jgi:hypothetical protein
MGNAPLGHEMCGHVLNLDLSARVAVLDQEGQRPLKLEEQITQSFDEGADLGEQIELDRDLPSPRSSSRKCLVIVRGIVSTLEEEARDMVATIILPSPSAEVPGSSNLQLTLTKLHAQLPVLYQHVSGPFLSGL